MNRTATASWNGAATTGTGSLDAPSGTLAQTPFSFQSRFGDRVATQTTPEELLAAAHASCYAMSLGFALEVAGTPAEQLDVQAEVSLAAIDGGFEISGIRLSLAATVPGVSDEALEELAQAAKALCPLSLALHSVPISLKVSRR